jgi:hypothetical protein
VYRAWAARAERGTTALVAGVALLPLGLVASLLAAQARGPAAAVQVIGAALGTIGVLIVCFPLATPRTTRALGVQAAGRLARGAGVGLLLAGGALVAGAAFT